MSGGSQASRGTTISIRNDVTILASEHTTKPRELFNLH